MAFLFVATQTLVAAIPATIAANFKVYDYTAYSLIGRMENPEFWNEWAFGAMDSIIRTQYNVQHYLLIAKEIDPSNGKVKFRVKLSVPTTKSTFFRSNSSERSGNLEFKENDINILNDAIKKVIGLFQVEKGEYAEHIGGVEKATIEYIIEWTEKIKNRTFEKTGWYVMPTGDFIYLSKCLQVEPPDELLSGVLYGWFQNEKEGNIDKKYLYEADIRNNIFYGYKKYSMEGGRATLIEPLKYFTEDDYSTITAPQNIEVKYLNFTSSCFVDVFQNIRNFTTKTRRLDGIAVNWAIPNTFLVDNRTQNFKQNFAVAINFPTSTCIEIGDLALQILKTESPKLGSNSSAIKSKAITFCNLLANLDEDLRQDFWKFDKNNKLTIFVSEIDKFFFDFKIPRKEENYDKAIAFLNDYVEKVKKFKQACLTKNINPDDYYKDNFYKFFWLTNNYVLKGPIIKLSIEERISLLKHELDRVYVNGAAFDNYCNPEEMIMMAAQTTPEAQQGTLLTKLKSEKIGPATNPKALITAILQKMDGLNAWQLNKTSEALLNFWHKNDANYLKYKKFIEQQGTATDQSDVVTANEIAQNGFVVYHDPNDIPTRGTYNINNQIVFTNAYTKLKAPYEIPTQISGGGTVTPSTTTKASLINKQSLNHCEEYQIILLVPFKTFKFGDKEFVEGNTYALPAFYYYTILNEREAEATVDKLVIAVEIASYATGFGELATAVRVGKGLKAAKAILDIAIQIPGTWMTLAPNDPFFEQNPNFTKAYTIFSLLYGGGQIAGAGLARFRSQTDDLVDLVDNELAAVHNELKNNPTDAALLKKEKHWDELSTACKNGKCFTAGTIIPYEDGDIKIEHVKKDMRVYSFDFEKKAPTLQRVVRTFQRTTNQLVHLFIGKDTIHTTPEHPFYDGTAWIKAANLRKGAKVFLFSTLLATVDSSYTQDTVCTVYNFEVENTHNYFVGKERVLVHNATYDCETAYKHLKDLLDGTYIGDLKAWKNQSYKYLEDAMAVEGIKRPAKGSGVVYQNHHKIPLSMVVNKTYQRTTIMEDAIKGKFDINFSGNGHYLDNAIHKDLQAGIFWDHPKYNDLVDNALKDLEKLDSYKKETDAIKKQLEAKRLLEKNLIPRLNKFIKEAEDLGIPLDHLAQQKNFILPKL